MGNLLSSSDAKRDDAVEEQAEEDQAPHEIQLRADIGRGPAALRRGRLPEGVREYLLQAVEPACADSREALEAVMPLWDMTHCPEDYPHKPGHYYAEGYAHALGDTPVTRTVASMNPRWGHTMRKKSAPAALRAFLKAFRVANAEWIERIFYPEADDALAQHPGVVALQPLIEAGAHFADLALQVHCGDAISEVDELGWHADGKNSILHMAVALHGRRALHCTFTEASDPLPDTPPTHKPGVVVRDGVYRELWQEPGDVYISSPYVFRHAVEYPECEWGDRVVALQCRFLLRKGNPSFGPVDLEPLMERVAAVLRKAEVVIPTLDDIHQHEAASE